MQDYLTSKILESIFFDDGSLRDIYVFDTNLKDWQSFLDWTLLSDCSIELYIDGEKTKDEKMNASILFLGKKRHVILLTIDFKGVLINCHFFSKDEIEFDIDPKEIKSLSRARVVFEFMRKLSDVLNKEIILTEENTPQYPLVILKSDGTMDIQK